MPTTDKVPLHYKRRQTLKSAERYITEELKTFEDQVLSSRERAQAREQYCYEQLVNSLQSELVPLQAMAAAIARLDVLCAFTERAITLDFCCPELSEQTGHRHTRRTSPGDRTRAIRSFYTQPYPDEPAAPHADHYRPQHGR